MNSITAIIINAEPNEPYLRGKTTVGGVQSFPVAGISGVDLLVTCADGATLAIAYVSASQLLHLVRSGAFVPRIAQLREHSPWSYLIVRDSLTPNGGGQTLHDGKQTGWSWASVQGAVLSAQELGVGVLAIHNEQQLDDTIIQLANRDRSTKRLTPPRDVLWQDVAEQILTALPGIGPEKADDLLMYCRGTVAAALQTLTDPEAPAPSGIGPATRQKIREAMGLKPGQYLAIYDTNDDGLMTELATVDRLRTTRT